MFFKKRFVYFYFMCGCFPRMYICALCVVSSYRSSHADEPVSMSDALDLELQLGPHILNIQEIPSLQALAVVIYIQMQLQSSSSGTAFVYK